MRIKRGEERGRDLIEERRSARSNAVGWFLDKLILSDPITDFPEYKAGEAPYLDYALILSQDEFRNMISMCF